MALVDYIIIKGDIPTNIVPADGPFDLGDARFTMEVYDSATHDATRDTSFHPVEFVNKDQFLFELLNITEQLTLQYHVENIPAQADWTNPSPGIVASLYRALRLAESQLQNVERVQLSSGRTGMFLDICFQLGVFGSPTDDPAVIAAYAARKTSILLGRKPDGTYFE